MSKWYKYKVVMSENADTEEKTFLDKAMTYNEANLPIVQKEAYNGEYTIKDDGQPEPEVPESPDESSVWDELDAAYQKGVDSV